MPFGHGCGCKGRFKKSLIDKFNFSVELSEY